MSYIYFRVTAHTRFNQQVCISGDHESLGSWDVHLAVPLSTDSDTYPLWLHAQKIQIPINTKVEFKIIIVEGPNICWEAGPNRNFAVDAGKIFIDVRDSEMQIRRFLRSQQSEEYSQEDLNLAEKMKMSREYNPFSEGFDSSDESMNSLDFILGTGKNVTSIIDLDDEEQKQKLEE